MTPGEFQHKKKRPSPTQVEVAVEAAPVLAPVPRMGWQAAISSTVEGLGYELVDVERAQRGLLRITIDRVPGCVYSSRGGLHVPGDGASQPGDSGEFITVEDCEKVTRQLQYALEVEGLDYARLEVSSPGLDRPLKKPADYVRFAGLAIQVTLKVPFQGRKNWQGVLTAVAADAASGASDVAGAELASEAASEAASEVESEAAIKAAAPPESWSLLVTTGKTEQVLGFTLQEVREARLVPVVNFKGRKAAGGAEADALAPSTQQQPS